MPDETVDVPEQQVGPTAEELMATVHAERQERARLESEKLRLETMLATRREPQAQPMGREDPLDTYSREMFSKSPEENRALLDRGLNQRVGQAAGKIRNEVSQMLAAERQAMEADRSLDRVMFRNPDIALPENQTKFAAMIQKAQLDVAEQGLRLSMDQIAERAVREYRQTYTPSRAKAPAYVEGSSAPGAGGTGYPGQEPGPVQKNTLEEAYGFEAGAVEAVSAESMKRITRDHVRAKNAEARRHGIGTSLIITPASEVS